ncbi:semaphorin-4A isoform X2 [Tachysurus fulvidraco]|uniref:semaphorin-4A isoform X2 n=1 Tax=Tachysurus fulvidraco TaxID=1234273 RepID=UPI001FF020E7|nr:semaphorin-4A isoform X2 [Tachysurus fulvidraco]
MASIQQRSLTVSLFFIIILLLLSSNRCHPHIIPRVTFPLESPGRPFTVFSLPDVYNTTTLLLSDDEETLFVGARNAILSLSISNTGHLQLSKKIDWSPTNEELKECGMKGTDEMDCPNFVRVLQVLNSTHMFACGTFAFSPRCSFISEQFTLAVNPSGKPEEGRGRCPYNPYHKNTAITVGGELYTATVADYQGNRPIISRHLSEGDHVDMKLDDSSGWLEDPTFISSTYIPSEEKVYFFFSELGREYDFIDKFTVSRIAQVCTSDVGGQRTLQRRWTTFAKAQLLCQTKGELPYNVLQDMTILKPPEGADEDDTLFYGIFSSQWSVNSGRSAVCVFSLRDIKNVFTGNFKVLNRDTLKWSKRTGPQEKIAKPGECGLHNASDNVLRFVKENFLADKRVASVSQELTLVSPDQRYSNVVAQRVKGANGSEYTVLYLLTESGYLHKAVLLEGEAHIIEEIQVLKQPQHITNLLISVSKGAVFVGSAEGVASVPVSNCAHYRSCAECVLARDPFCAWDSTQLMCALVSSIKQQLVQDVDEGNVLKVCKSFNTLTPRGRFITPGTHSERVLVSLRDVVRLHCQVSSQLSVLHWERLGGELSSDIYILKDDRSLTFLATPTTLGTYKCLATEHNFTQTLAIYEVRQKQESTFQPSSTPSTLSPQSTREATSPPPKPETMPGAKDEKPVTEETQKATTGVAAITVMPSSSNAPDNGSTNRLQLESSTSYLKELVAVTVLLVMCICALLLVAAYNLRKYYHSRTVPHLPSIHRDTGSTEGGMEHERQALKGDSPQLDKHNGQKSPNTPSNGVSSGSNGHLPNIPI